MIKVVPKILSKHPSTGMKFFPGKDYLYCPGGKLTVQLQLDYGRNPKDPVTVVLQLRSLDPDLFRFKDGQNEMAYIYDNVHPDSKETLVVNPEFYLITDAEQKTIERKQIRICVQTSDQRTPKQYGQETALWTPLFMPVV